MPRARSAEHSRTGENGNREGMKNRQGIGGVPSRVSRQKSSHSQETSLAGGVHVRICRMEIEAVGNRTWGFPAGGGLPWDAPLHESFRMKGSDLIRSSVLLRERGRRRGWSSGCSRQATELCHANSLRSKRVIRAPKMRTVRCSSGSKAPILSSGAQPR